VENCAPLLPSIQQQGENNKYSCGVFFCLHLHHFNRKTEKKTSTSLARRSFA
jgi:hypothetical protein